MAAVQERMRPAFQSPLGRVVKVKEHLGPQKEVIAPLVRFVSLMCG
jgi:hypothetical protein